MKNILYFAASTASKRIFDCVTPSDTVYLD